MSDLVYRPRWLPRGFRLTESDFGIEGGADHFESFNDDGQLAVRGLASANVDWNEGRQFAGRGPHHRVIDGPGLIRHNVLIGPFHTIQVDALRMLSSDVDGIVESIPLIGTPEAFFELTDETLEEPSPALLCNLAQIPIDRAAIEREVRPHSAALTTIVHQSGSSAIMFILGSAEENPLADVCLNLQNPTLVVGLGVPLVSGRRPGVSTAAMWHQGGWYWHIVLRGSGLAVEEASRIISLVTAV